MTDDPTTPTPAPAKKAPPAGGRLAELEAENAELRAALAALAAAGIRRPEKAPHRPSFGISEGTREELERTGRSTDPFTGEPIGDWTGIAGHDKDYGVPDGVEV